MRLALLVVAACSAPPRETPLSNTQPAAASPPLEVKMTRSMCFGECPAYTVAIHSDGRVDWQGDQYVSVKGAAHATISGDQLAAISAELDRVAFFSLDAQGKPPSKGCSPGHACVSVICTDTSHTTIEVTRGTQHHTIDNAHCTELAVDHLEIVIDKAANTQRWIGTHH